jgi:hypothetical protein
MVNKSKKIEAAMKLRPTNKREVQREAGAKRRVTLSTSAGAETTRYTARLQQERSEGNCKVIGLSVALRNDESAIVW